MTLANGVQLAADSATTYTKGAMRYVAATLKVRNAQTDGTAYSAASHNLTLVAAETSATISQTAVSKMKLFDGSNATSSLATQLVPAEGPVVGQQSLQVFSEAEVASMAPASGVTSLLPYGFVVANVSDPSTRSLPASPAAGDYEGSVTVAVAFPVQSPATANPFSVSLVLQAVDDSNLRVTQGAPNAAALGSHDVAVLGQQVANTNDGHPICTVRTAGTAASPTAYLVNNGTANLASLPSGLSSLSPTAAVNAGFCKAMTTGGATYSQFVVSGSESPQRVPSAAYAGTWAATANGIAFTPGKPFFTGERVSFTVTSGLTSTGGLHPQGFVGQTYAGGARPSSGSFTGYATNELIPSTGSTSYGIAAADLDGDGVADIAEFTELPSYSNSTQDATIWFGNGDGTFGAPVSYPTGGTGAPLGIAAADFTGDGHPDLLLNTATSLYVFVNNGDGTFGSAIPMAHENTGTSPTPPAVADVNGDGHLDVMLSDAVSPDFLVFTGDGTGHFNLRTIITSYTSNAIVAFDENRDGHVDLALTSAGCVDYEQGDGSGTFNPNQSCLAVDSSPGPLVATDLNADGIPDLVTYDQSDFHLATLLGSSSGAFTVNKQAAIGQYTASALVAVAPTPEASPELVLADSRGQLDVVLNSYGTLSPGVEPIVTPYRPIKGSLAVGDVNGDGDADLVRGFDTQYYNEPIFDALTSDGSGYFSDVNRAGQTTSVAYSPGIEVPGDFNGDGRLDLATFWTGTKEGTILTSDGTSLTTALNVNAANNGLAMVAGDWNGDGALDLAVLTDSTVQFFQNSGTGQMTSKATVAVPAGSEAMAVGDVNADGRPDVVVVGSAGATVVTNDGAFSFDTAAIPSVTGGGAVDLVDLDGDGRLDLVLGNGFLVQTVPGNGNGTFGTPVTLGSYAPTRGGSTPIGSLAVADLNGDGTPDIAFTVGTLKNQVGVIYRQPGGGHTAATVPTPVQPSQLVVGDVNGDGRLDLVAGGTSVSVLVQGPSGLAPAVHERVQLLTGSVGLALGDFLGTSTLQLAVAEPQPDSMHGAYIYLSRQE